MKTAFDDFFDDILNEAIKKEASDIHFEPRIEYYLIRIRIDGVLREHFRILRKDQQDVIERIVQVVKKSCQFNLSIYGKIQDTRFSRVDLGYDFRASLIPVMEGEKIVLRLLTRTKEFNLQTYPLLKEAKEDLLLALEKSQGLIIISGPTGSGKSTLLYSALASCPSDIYNIHTVEDPVEYRLNGISQSAINSNLSFSDSLKSLMRQDPDIILVGEIRDKETAKSAIEASMTGHIVLSTVHANDVDMISKRFETLGINKDVYEESITFASAQRLLPRLCPFCKKEDHNFLPTIRKYFSNIEKCYCPNENGCKNCFNGIKGRVLIFSWMFDKTLKRDMKLSLELAMIEGNISARDAFAYL
jgi:type II secretory ATPase GspE/PulE/Tfp pilus assembly ATPase PilB-like protein